MCPQDSVAEQPLVHLPRTVNSKLRPWPKEGFTRAPYWVYSDGDVYAQEQAKIFRGKTWNYLGLEAEVPEPGSFKTTYIGETSVLLTRAEDGSLNALVNRCSHRGNMVCREAFGKTQKLNCVYHAWNYNLKGDLTHAAFSKGIRGEGGLPKDFDMARHGLQKLRVESLRGVVFASFSAEVEPDRKSVV